VAGRQVGVPAEKTWRQALQALSVHPEEQAGAQQHGKAQRVPATGSAEYQQHKVPSGAFRQGPHKKTNLPSSPQMAERFCVMCFTWRVGGCAASQAPVHPPLARTFFSSASSLQPWPPLLFSFSWPSSTSPSLRALQVQRVCHPAAAPALQANSATAH
jgi:hypothetical protein